jgi:hypothetical protein
MGAKTTTAESFGHPTVSLGRVNENRKNREATDEQTEGRGGGWTRRRSKTTLVPFTRPDTKKKKGHRRGKMQPFVLFVVLL